MVKVVFVVVDDCGLHRVHADVAHKDFVGFCSAYYKKVEKIGGAVLEIFAEDVPCLNVLRKMKFVD